MSARDLMEVDESIVVSLPIFKPGDWANYEGRSYRIKHTVISARNLLVQLDGVKEPVPAHRLEVAWTRMSVRPRRSFAAASRAKHRSTSAPGQ